MRLLKKWFIYFFAQANQSAKCPACGIRALHELQFHPLAQQLVHGCKRCHATWAEPALVDPNLWHTVPKVQPQEREDKLKVVGIPR